MTCGEGNAFNKASLRCDSLDNVAKVDPECGESGVGGGGRDEVVIAGRSRGGERRGGARGGNKVQNNSSSGRRGNTSGKQG